MAYPTELGGNEGSSLETRLNDPFVHNGASILDVSTFEL